MSFRSILCLLVITWRYVKKEFYITNAKEFDNFEEGLEKLEENFQRQKPVLWTPMDKFKTAKLQTNY